MHNYGRQLTVLINLSNDEHKFIFMSNDMLPASPCDLIESEVGDVIEACRHDKHLDVRIVF